MDDYRSGKCRQHRRPAYTTYVVLPDAEIFSDTQSGFFRVAATAYLVNLVAEVESE